MYIHTIYIYYILHAIDTVNFSQLFSISFCQERQGAMANGHKHRQVVKVATLLFVCDDPKVLCVCVCVCTLSQKRPNTYKKRPNTYTSAPTSVAKIPNWLDTIPPKF